MPSLTGGFLYTAEPCTGNPDYDFRDERDNCYIESTVRDFSEAHPDFERTSPHQQGAGQLVADELLNGRPVLRDDGWSTTRCPKNCVFPDNGARQEDHIASDASFNQWYAFSSYPRPPFSPPTLHHPFRNATLPSHPSVSHPIPTRQSMSQLLVPKVHSFCVNRSELGRVSEET